MGSHILDRLLKQLEGQADEDGIREQIREEWSDLEIAWRSTSADQRVALTRLQIALASWTATTALVAEDEFVQRYRKLMHHTLDH